jgi:hypothetical protein
MGVLRLVCGAKAHVAEDRARLLEPPWVRGWYQIVRNLELVILVVERSIVACTYSTPVLVLPIVASVYRYHSYRYCSFIPVALVPIHSPDSQLVEHTLPKFGL